MTHVHDQHCGHGHGDNPIDIHAHFFPQQFLQAIAKAGPDCGAEIKEIPGKGMSLKVADIQLPPLTPQFVHMDARLEAMAAAGVSVHALSLSLPMVDWAKRPFAHQLSEIYNDAATEACIANPDKLLNFISLPMNEPDLAIRELTRMAGLPSTRGVYLSTQISGHDLSDEKFFTIYEAIEAAGLPIFLHPCEVIGNERLKKFYLQNLLGNPFETAIAAGHLIFGGVLDRFPKITWVLPHAGGAFPYLIGRLQRGYDKRREPYGCKLGPTEYLRHFYYDTISYADKSLQYLKDLVGADRIMMGSDYCFPIAYERPVEIVTAHAGFNAEEQALVLEGNARRLLRL